jgi:transcriptional regulator with XRE-family HTH domain
VDSRQTAYAATAVDPQTRICETAMIEQTALARLMQDRREAAGYSRARLGKTLGISSGTIEGWELGRIGKPPFHEVMRIAAFLRIPLEDLQRAVREPPRFDGDFGVPRLPESRFWPNAAAHCGTNGAPLEASDVPSVS